MERWKEARDPKTGLRLLDRRQVAEVLRVSERTVRRIDPERLPVVRIVPRRPLYRLSDVMKLIDDSITDAA